MPDAPKTPIAALREELGLTLEQFAVKLGLASKGYASDMEKSGRCSVRVAFEIERLSDGRIPAASLNPDIGIVEAARGIAA